MQHHDDHHSDEDTPYELSSEWQDWVTENALEGASADELIEAIVEEGISQEVVTREVTRLLSSGPMRAAYKWRQKALRFKKLNALRVALHRGHGPHYIERVSGLSPQELRERYVRFGQPVILTDVIDQWPALQRWNDEYLKEHLGEIEVTYCAGRSKMTDYDRDIKRFFTTSTFAQFIDHIAEADETNDFYLVGNNRFIDQEEAQCLLQDLDPKIATYLTNGVVSRFCSFWFGPAGTVTTLHHDPASVLYAQIRGQKRFRLLAPSNEAALLSADKTYSKVDVESAAKFMNDRIYEVILQPGELLFLPVGWWHEVTALSTSISLGFTNLLGPTSFSWYYPGNIT